jgi:hypothetical protein
VLDVWSTEGAESRGPDPPNESVPNRVTGEVKVLTPFFIPHTCAYIIFWAPLVWDRDRSRDGKRLEQSRSLLNKNFSPRKVFTPSTIFVCMAYLLSNFPLLRSHCLIKEKHWVLNKTPFSVRRLKILRTGQNLIVALPVSHRLCLKRNGSFSNPNRVKDKFP